MKKFLIIAACALVLLGIIAVAAVSQNDLQVDITPDKMVVCRGDTVSFTVHISGDQAFTSAGYIPYYESEAFELIRTEILTDGHVLADFPVDADGGVVAFDTAAARSGDIFRFTVRIRDDAPLGAFTVTDAMSIMNDRNKVDHVVNEVAVTVADHKWNNATCTESKTCSVCKATEGEPLGHKWTDATCTAPKTCSVCKATEGQPLGHKWTDATCTTPKTCSVCKTTEGAALGHKWTDATCTAPKTCSVCKATEGAALGHKWSDATCTTAKTCSVCKATEGSALGHKWTDATCTDPKTCSVCKATEGAALGHKWSDATCTTAKTCSVCKTTEGQPLGHKWTDATCTDPKTCSICKATEGAALGHKWSDATCTTPKTCSVCKTTEGQPLGHKWTDATCTTPKTCSVCKATEGAALGHKWSDATCTEPKTCSVCKTTEGQPLVHKWTDATCTAPKTCSVCKATEGAALGHKWSDATCTTAKTCSVCKTTEGQPLGHKWTDATCTEPKTCSVCKSTEGQANGHSYGEWSKLDETHHGKICSSCDDVQKEPHTYENNLCAVCGDHEIWSYTISNSAVTITGYTGPDGELHFPDKIDGVTVTTVAANAFKNASITKVIYSGRTKAWDAMTIGSGNEALKNATRICTGDVRFASATLTLENNLSVDFKIDEAMCTQQGFENPYIVFTFNGKETIVREYDYDKTQKRYIFHFRNVAASQCNDTIYAVVHATADGTEYTSKVLEYSVATYCYAQLAQPAVIANTELRTLLVDLLNYGAVSQQYMNYKTDALVNAGLTAEQKSWASNPETKLTTVLNTKYQTVENPTAKWKSAGLVLESAIDMRLQLETTNIDGLCVKISTDKQTWTIDSSAFEIAPGTNRYYVHFNALHAAQMSEPVYLTVYRDGVAVSNTLRYSIESYAQDKQNDTATPYLAELVKAMMNYGNSAYAYTH